MNQAQRLYQIMIEINRVFHESGTDAVLAVASELEQEDLQVIQASFQAIASAVTHEVETRD